MSRVSFLTAGILVLVQIAHPLSAQIWDGGAGTLNWADAENWNPDGVPAANGVVEFNGGIPAGSALPVNVGGGNHILSSLTFNNGADFTLDFTGGTAESSFTYGSSITVADAHEYRLINDTVIGRSLALNNTLQQFDIASGGKLILQGNIVVGSNSTSKILKTGEGELDLATHVTGHAGESRLSGIEAQGGITRVAVKPARTWLINQGLASSNSAQLYFVGDGTSVLEVEDTTVATAGSSVTLDGVTLMNDSLTPVWVNSKASYNLINGGALDLRGQGRDSTGTIEYADRAVRVDGLNGTGNVFQSWNNPASEAINFIVGVNDGDGSFSGVIYGSGQLGIAEAAFTAHLNLTNPVARDGNTGYVNLVKNGIGAQTLNGVNVYTGTTTVNAGSLIIGDTVGSNASLATGSAVTVAQAGLLGGQGTIGGNTTIQGTLAPGASAGSLAFGSNLTLDGSSLTSIELGGTTFDLNVVEEYDRIQLTGTSSVLTLGGTLDVSLINGFTLGADQAFGIVQLEAGATRVGTFAGLASDGALVGTFGGQQLFITYSANFGGSGLVSLTGGNDIALYTVPEPGSAVVLLLGAVVGLRFRRRQATGG